ncbi:MAG: hypothetical protein WCK47_11540 [bacterium]
MRHVTAIVYATVIVAHCALFGALASVRGTWPDPPLKGRLIVELDASKETEKPRYLVASLPEPAGAAQQGKPPPEAPRDNRQPPAGHPPPSQLPQDVRNELQKERDELRAQIERERAGASALAGQAAQQALAVRSRAADIAAGSRGTVRELDFAGWPNNVVDEIMTRYRLRITRQTLRKPSNQSFLSTAADASGDRYYADNTAPPGVYEVFELSRESVAKMSRMEEEEIKRRSLDLEHTRVTRVKFGIVEVPPGKYDIGILFMNAEPIP